MTIHTPRPVLSAAEVAALLNYSHVGTFYAKRVRLEGLGFPAKLPGINGWSRNAVLRWIDQQLEPQESAAPHSIVIPRNALEERYAS